MRKAESQTKITIAGVVIEAGKRTDVELKVTRLPTGTWVSVPVAALRGSRPGPCIWVSAAIHGDEFNGVDIVRRLLQRLTPAKLRGTVLAVPIVNVLGFLNQERYLPDRRDLNRSFPGSTRGSLAARMAHLFLTEIVNACQYGIDLHTGSNHRTNFPQIRVNFDDPEACRLARAFGAPVTIHANARDGSLRQVAAERGCPVLVYEAGETHRFDSDAINRGMRGVLRVLRALKMLEEGAGAKERSTRFIRETRWVRAPRGGILLLDVKPGDIVTAGQVLARITDTFSVHEREILAPFPGVVIGSTTNPLVNRGDAVVNLGAIDPDAGSVA